MATIERATLHSKVSTPNWDSEQKSLLFALERLNAVTALQLDHRDCRIWECSFFAIELRIPNGMTSLKQRKNNDIPMAIFRSTQKFPPRNPKNLL